jgi:hypothetical protein
VEEEPIKSLKLELETRIGTKLNTTESALMANYGYYYQQYLPNPVGNADNLNKVMVIVLNTMTCNT